MAVKAVKAVEATKATKAVEATKAAKTTNLSYRELKAMVPATPKGKMPRAKELMGAAILFSEEFDGARISVFKNGYLTYTVTDNFGIQRTTVYSVHRCDRIVYQTGCSNSEFKEECGWYGEHCKLVYRIIKGQLMRFAIVSEEAYLDAPWWMPVVEICEERLLQNANERFNEKFDLRDNDEFDDDSDEFDPETWLEAEIETVNQAMDHNRLMAALDTLTDVQYTTVRLYFGKSLRRPKDLAKLSELGVADDFEEILDELEDVTDKMTERKVAEILGTTQVNVHKNLQAALRKLRKNFFK